MMEHNNQDMDDENYQMSSYGTGVKNRQLAQQYANLSDLKSYESWNEVAQYQSLEPEVFESHDDYAGSIGISNSGASALTMRSDDNNVVPFVGLRRPDYHSTYAGPDARQQHSEFVDQMPASTHYLL
jgi:hypothetical protein